MEFDSFVLAASTADLGDEPAARAHADALEFRMDLASDALSALAAYDGELPLLVTNRVEWEGGEARDGDDRIDALCAAVEHDAVEAVDVELASVEDGDGQVVVDHAHDHGAKAVVSAHDFEGMPTPNGMRDLLEAACQVGDVGKLAGTATDREDVLDLLTVTYGLHKAGRQVATMAMGEAGRHSRAIAPVYGSRIGYAPVDPADATAPGQYDLATLAALVERLQSRA